LSSTRTRNPASARRVGRGAVLSPTRRRKKRLGWLGRSVLACGLASLALIAWAVLARALAPKGNTQQTQFDVLIVLGNSTDADGNPTPIEQARVAEAVHEYEQGAAPRMIFTGGAVANQFVEAQVMARAAEARGIPATAIIEETRSRNTIENACDSLRIMRSHGWSSAEVVTSTYHLPRAAIIFSRLPLKWRIQAASTPETSSDWFTAYITAMDVLKTVHYLLWSRQTAPCEL
jgi:uncharacterized SAM-binding protein YcdF (DUF218 family)